MNIQLILNEQTPSVAFIKNVKEWINNNQELINSFYEFIKTKPYAIGLASNQVSVNGERCKSRFFLKKNLFTNEWTIIVNPKIIKTIGLKEGRVEGCLTWPNKDVIAYRYRRIEVEYYNDKGEYKKELITKFNAHIWQHEINHLDGIEERVVEPATVWFTNNKINRNDKCPCGSGLKYKKCCGLYEIDDYVLQRTR